MDIPNQPLENVIKTAHFSKGLKLTWKNPDNISDTLRIVSFFISMASGLGLGHNG